MRVLEVGCGEGGILRAFIERDCMVVGIDIDSHYLEHARELLTAEVADGKVHLHTSDVNTLTHEGEFSDQFDIIILKDAIEHIHQQKGALLHLRSFLRPSGILYAGFPPWYAPFGGHQHWCVHWIPGRLPFTHLLPSFLYTLLLRLLGESKESIETLKEVKGCGISIERFERIAREAGYFSARKLLYFINPIYQYKFGLKPRILWRWLAYIPFVRNFVTTSAYYLLRPSTSK